MTGQGDRTKGNGKYGEDKRGKGGNMGGYKKRGKHGEDIRKKLFTVRVVKHQHRLPRRVVYIPSLETFRVRLDRTLKQRDLDVGVPIHCRGVGPDGL